MVDPKTLQARDRIVEHVDGRREEVFYLRELQVLLEREFFHWVTARAVRMLVDEEYLLTEARTVAHGGEVVVLRHRSCRYYKRRTERLVELVGAYSHPDVTAAVGNYGELLVLEGFVRRKFSLYGRNVREYTGRTWTRTGHDLDFIFERDGVGWGVEVKNTLPYIEEDEYRAKQAMCDELGVRAVFACRMLPKDWITEIIDEGGYAMVMGWQMYPKSEAALVARMREELGLPADTPARLQDGTMDKFERVHRRVAGV